MKTKVGTNGIGRFLLEELPKIGLQKDTAAIDTEDGIRVRSIAVQVVKTRHAFWGIIPYHRTRKTEIADFWADEDGRSLVFFAKVVKGEFAGAIKALVGRLERELGIPATVIP